MKTLLRVLGVTAALLVVACSAERVPAADNTPPTGFTPLFNGKDLAGWKEKGKEGSWKVDKGVIAFDGKGGDLVTEKEYRNFVLHVDWKIEKGGDSGVFPRGVPQIQIWDNAEGSGGLWNDKVKALKKADKPIGEWNHFEITVEKGVITVVLNGETVVDKYAKDWKNKERGPIHLQNHGNPLWFKNIYIKELAD
jgi:hypothetical protein